MPLVRMRTEVIGTVRVGDDRTGEIDGLVIRQIPEGGGFYIIDKPTAVEWAIAGLLWTHIPGDGRPVDLIAIDSDGDGRPDYVKTKADGVRQNNLLALPYYDRKLKTWRNPHTGASTLSP